ncbi:MAG: PAS domain S-box protein [Syntrophobacteraceae bacterium]
MRAICKGINAEDGKFLGGIGIFEDITERKQAEERLKDSEQQLRSIIQGYPIPAFVIGKDHQVIYWNKALEEMSSMRAKDVVGTRRHWMAFYSAERPCMADLLVDEAASEGIFHWYNGIANKSNLLNQAYEATDFFPELGEEGKWLHFTAAAIRNSQGMLVGAIETLVDVTARKKAQEALISANRRLNDIIDFLPDATFVIDKKGMVIAWNRAIEKMTGIRAADILGKGSYEYALPFYGERRPILIDLVLEPRQEIEQHYAALEKTDRAIAGEAYMPGLGDGKSYLFGMASALFDSKGNVVGAIESLRDISERKLMEKAVVEAEVKYRGIFENALMGIFQTTPAGRFLSANMALARIIGYDSPEEVLNTVNDISRQLYVNPEHRSELLRLIEEQEVVQDFEVQFFRKDKSIAWITLNIRAVRDIDGKIIHMEGIAQDITDSKLLAFQLNHAQKMEAIGTLAGGIAHDFNNILAPIIGYSELSLNAVPKESRLHHNMEQILLSANRARDLVKQILAVSRRVEPTCRPVQVSLLIKETLKLLRPSLPSTIEIRQNLDEGAIESTVMADPSQIHQVLMNLCTNAHHAMREKGGVLSITLKNVDFDADTKRDVPDLEPGSYLRLSVADTGHGIVESVRRRIFDPYFTTKGPAEGTGLGLALVYGIVKNLAGEIAVFTEPGQGATFAVYFPRTKMIQVPMAEALVPLPTGKGLVLVVDDEMSIVEMLKDMLESLGYEVATRYSSSDALQAFRAHPETFDLVITDMTMPHMTGLALAKEILRIRADIPIILCTGFSEAVNEDRAKLPGIRQLLMKPVAMRDLAAAVNKIIVEDKPIT